MSTRPLSRSLSRTNGNTSSSSSSQTGNLASRYIPPTAQEQATYGYQSFQRQEPYYYQPYEQRRRRYDDYDDGYRVSYHDSASGWKTAIKVLIVAGGAVALIAGAIYVAKHSYFEFRPGGKSNKVFIHAGITPTVGLSSSDDRFISMKGKFARLKPTTAGRSVTPAASPNPEYAAYSVASALAAANVSPGDDVDMDGFHPLPDMGPLEEAIYNAKNSM